jgi:flagellar biosynthesis GTPase FlhF
MMETAMKAHGLIFGASACLLGAAWAATAQTVLPQVIVQDPSDQREAQQMDDQREAEQADADRREAESADRQRRDREQQRRRDREEQSDMDELQREEQQSRRDEQRRNEQAEAEVFRRMEEGRREMENAAAEDNWREEEQKRMEACQTAMPADKKQMIADANQYYGDMIRSFRAAGSAGAMETAAQMARTRDAIIAGIVDAECAPPHDRLRRQRNEDGVARVLDGTLTPPPFRIEPAGTPRGN